MVLLVCVAYAVSSELDDDFGKLKFLDSENPQLEKCTSKLGHLICNSRLLLKKRYFPVLLYQFTLLKLIYSVTVSFLLVGILIVVSI